MSTNGTTGALAAALVAAQAEMPAVEPDSVNPHYKNKFVSLDHLIAKTRPVLNKHGLAITQAPTHIDGAPALATTIYHASGESATTTMPLILARDDMQGVGSAVTYARRYAWAALLGISEQEDDDGEAASTLEPEPRASKPQQNNVHRLISKIVAEGVLEEVQIREGMQQAYGTQITARLSKSDAGDLITRLKAKAGEE